MSVVLLDLGIQQQPAPGDCAQARLGRRQRGSERAGSQGCQPPQERHLAADLVELLAQGVRRADDYCLERLHGLRPRLDRGVASDLEVTDHLDRARAGLRLSGSLASKHGARGAFGIHGVAFAMLIPQLPIGPVDLDDGMSWLAKNRDRPAP